MVVACFWDGSLLILRLVLGWSWLVLGWFQHGGGVFLSCFLHVSKCVSGILCGPGVVLGRMWSGCGVILGCFWDDSEGCSGVVLWDSGMVLGRFWAVLLGVVLGWLWDGSRTVLG